MKLLKKTSSLRSIKGFTLIELLVAISIIAILSTILMVNFSGVRGRNRDARRKSDLKQIQTALELYRSDKGFYPDSALPIDPTGNMLFPTTCNGTFTDSNGTEYMPKLPCDPSTGLVYTYTPSNGNLKYTLTACLENTKDQEADAVNTCASPKKSFTVTNP